MIGMKNISSKEKLILMLKDYLYSRGWHQRRTPSIMDIYACICMCGWMDIDRHVCMNAWMDMSQDRLFMVNSGIISSFSYV